jgi:hypothetical protein
VYRSTSQAARSSHRTTVRLTRSAGNDRALELARILEELSSLLESGQTNIADILKARHPDAYDELRPLIPILELLMELKHNES